MPIDRSQVEHIAALARISLSEAEIEAFTRQLSQILEQFDVLQSLDTAERSRHRPRRRPGQRDARRSIPTTVSPRRTPSAMLRDAAATSSRLRAVLDE